MKIAITGCNGRVGQPVVRRALRLGHEVVGIDVVSLAASTSAAQASPGAKANNFSTADSYWHNPKFSFIQADLREYDVVLKSLQGCEAVLHLAAYPHPKDYVAITHNNNVVISWNVLRAAAELGINRIAQASTVNVITMVYSKGPQFDYFPIDEDHPCRPDEPYGLSKLIAEIQADTIVRRYPTMRIASMRLHWSVPNRQYALRTDMERAKNDLWGYVQEDSAAEAFLLAVTSGDVKWSGHERFFITAPDISYDGDTAELRKAFWADVPIRVGKDVSGQLGFFDCSKAERLLGWKHKDGGTFIAE